MSNSELRKQLNELADEFVAGVLRAIQNVPLSQLATGVSEVRAGRGGRKAAGAGAKKTGAKKVTGKTAAGGERKLSRRKPGELDELRANILKVLRGTSSAVGA